MHLCVYYKQDFAYQLSSNDFYAPYRTPKPWTNEEIIKLKLVVWFSLLSASALFQSLALIVQQMLAT